MSDYGDDYSDYGDDFFYVEEEFIAADDLAEHAVASPPPTYADDDLLSDWDRFDYFNDLEYASDGYDDAKFQDAKIGQKRKRDTKAPASTTRPGWRKAPPSSRSPAPSSRPRKTAEDADSEAWLARMAHPPIVWRAQNDRDLELRLLSDNAPSYALLKDWREKLTDTPHWARGSPSRPKKVKDDFKSTTNAAHASEFPPTTSELLDDINVADDEQMDENEEGMDITQEALMVALQRQLAAAGGPLSGMDPQQLLDFAMRMATDKDAGDDIAGEMAEAMLDGEDEEDDGTAEENLMSWVAQQRNDNKDATAVEPKSPSLLKDSTRPPTPPSSSSEANRTTRTTDESSEAKSKTWTAKETRTTSTRKRKADDEIEAESSTKATKKRATRSFDAPTAASQAKATRTTKAKR